MSAAELIIKIEDESVRIDTHTQYGMRYPNGEIEWDRLPGTRGIDGFPLHVRDLAVKDGSHSNFGVGQRWTKHMEEQADKVKIDRAEYAVGHRIVKRSIIVSVTATEEV